VRKVLLGEGLEGRPQYLPYVLDLEVLVANLHHLQEGCDDGVVGLVPHSSQVRRRVLLLTHVLVDVLLHFGVEDGRQFVRQQSMGVLQEGDGVHLVGGQSVGLHLTLLEQFLGDLDEYGVAVAEESYVLGVDIFALYLPEG
jgi:hypothetical protein